MEFVLLPIICLNLFFGLIGLAGVSANNRDIAEIQDYLNKQAANKP